MASPLNNDVLNVQVEVVRLRHRRFHTSGFGHDERCMTIMDQMMVISVASAGVLRQEEWENCMLRMMEVGIAGIISSGQEGLL